MMQNLMIMNGCLQPISWKVNGIIGEHAYTYGETPQDPLNVK